jgi:hypothetical protein
MSIGDVVATPHRSEPSSNMKKKLRKTHFRLNCV